MSQPYRLPRGGRIDRGAPLQFTFDGRTIHGYQGDTLASALLANGAALIGRSFKYHRPRGIVAAGAEDPNAFVQLGRGARAAPNRLATVTPAAHGMQVRSVNAWPSLDYDVMSLLGLAAPFIPAGFYYKTLMWPRRLWPLYERVLRRAAGLGRAPSGPDPDRYDYVHARCDVLVVGAGPAGLAAARAAARRGARVILADEQPQPGGSLLASAERVDGVPGHAWAAAAAADLAASPRVTVLPDTTVFGLYQSNLALMVERRREQPGDAAGTERGARTWRVTPRRIVLASGAHERPLLCANNDLPGVMLASATAAYLHRYAAAPGSRAVFFTTNDTAYRAALDLAEAGVPVAAIADVRADPDGRLPAEARARGIQVLAAAAVRRVLGRRRVAAVELCSLDGSPRGVVECDLLGLAGGFAPALHLHAQAGGRTDWDPALAAFVPRRSNGVHPAGGAAGALGTAAALRQGAQAGASAAAAAGFTADAAPAPPGGGPELPSAQDAPDLGFQPYWVPPNALGRVKPQFVDLHEDVTLDDLRLTLREGFEAVEHVKRYTTLGMGPDQGKLANPLATGVLAELQGLHPAAVGAPRYRPAYTPVALGALAGRSVGALSDPLRATPMQAWHQAAGARFESVGQWRRPLAYPQRGETVHDAAARECLAVRRRVGLLDSSTLGKIEVNGPDAGEFLERVYVNTWKRLPPGRCRYGLMLGEDGMILDDGVTARLDERRYLTFTSTSGAAEVLAWLERWLQTEWPELRVYLTSVSEHWACLALAGPRSRETLAAAGTDIALDRQAFPHMTFRAGRVAGVRARVFRISFSGELSYEINVPADQALHVWETLLECGRPFGIAPYGTEAMHVLRAEKGYVIVGQETDGSVTPLDVGLRRMLSRRKDFLGKRSLSRPALLRADRKQLVGLRSDDPAQVVPEGAPLVDAPSRRRPLPMRGHVTSSYHSPALGRAIALALVSGGRASLGERLYAAAPDDRWIPVRSCLPIFYDPTGARLHV